jgi:glycyl-tRNA synthetase (class II)
VPFAVTVDYETVEKDTVTVRERDTTKQVCLIRLAMAMVALMPACCTSNITQP